MIAWWETESYYDRRSDYGSLHWPLSEKLDRASASRVEENLLGKAMSRTETSRR